MAGSATPRSIMMARATDSPPFSARGSAQSQVASVRAMPR